MSNEAAWIPKATAPCEVGPADMYTPGPDEVVVRVRAAAVNPMEAGIQKTGVMIEEYPAILGCDGAGEIYSTGSGVEGLEKGDRVLGIFAGVPPLPKADYRSVCYQRYAVTKARLVAKIPADVPFTRATVLPLAVTSAADSLFSERGMELPWPQTAAAPRMSGQVVIVWGGSSSVGTSAIQLLVSAGYTVAAVASARNHDLCRSAGASYTFDYNVGSTVDDIVKEFTGKQVAGIFNAIISRESLEGCIGVYSRLGLVDKLGTMSPETLPPPCEVPSGVKLGTGRCLAPIPSS